MIGFVSKVVTKIIIEKETFLQFAKQLLGGDFEWEQRSWSQKIAVVPRNGSRTIRHGMLQKVLGSWLSESVFRGS